MTPAPGPIAPHPHLAAKERLQGRKLMAKDGQQVRFASDDGYVHRRVGCKGRKYAAAQGKGARKAGVRRKDGQGLAVAGLPVQSAEIQL